MPDIEQKSAHEVHVSALQEARQGGSIDKALGLVDLTLETKCPAEHLPEVLEEADATLKWAEKTVRIKVDEARKTIESILQADEADNPPHTDGSKQPD